MRPQSIVGLIVAAVMIVAGLVICMIAGGMAKGADVQLFTKTENGTTKFQEEPFTGDGITKIEINVEDAAVHVIGGSETSYIELLNFDENYYTYTVSGKTITLTELKDVVSMLKFWENGFAFKGMRNVIWSVLKLGDKITGDKVVNIYLADANASLNNLAINMNNGTVSLQNLSLATDYVVTLNEGTITADHVTESSKLEIVAATDLSLDISRSSFANLLINNLDDKHKPVKTGAFVFSDSSFTTAAVYLTEGTLDLRYTTASGVPGPDSYTYNFTSRGKITYLGAEKTSPFTVAGSSPTGLFTVVSEKAAITVSQSGS